MKNLSYFEYLKIILGEQVSKHNKDDVVLPKDEDIKRSTGWQEVISLGRKILEKEVIMVDKWRILFFQVLLIGIFGVILSRLVILQVFSGPKLLAASFANQIRIETNRAPRGVIYDRNNQILAHSTPGFRIAMDAHNLSQEEVEKSLKELSKVVGQEEEEIKNKLEEAKATQTVTLAQEIDREKVFEIESRSKEFPGVQIEVSPIRTYPDSEVFASLIGFTGEVSQEELKTEDFKNYKSGDRTGKLGVEQIFERKLKGKDGQELITVDAEGHKNRLFGVVPPKNGESLNLSIESGLQKTLYREIEKKRSEVDSPGASAVALNPNTGEVLALVSSPSFDNNLFARGIKQKEYQKLISDPRKPLLNRSVGAVYPPASTFKIINASAALNERIIDKEAMIEAPAAIDLGGGAVFKDWKNHGLINVVTALAASSDSFFYKVGGGYGNQRGLGPEKLAEWAKKFGFGALTGIGMQNEVQGLVPGPNWKKETRGEDWYLGNTYNFSIGQGDLLVTPIQLANATASIANKGKLYKPTLIKDAPSVLIREKFVSKEVLEIVREGMRQATLPGGTAWPLRDFKISTAGKTGTGEAAGKETRPYAWYTGFAPFDNPNIVVTVVFENAGEGSNVAAPIVKKAFEYWFRDQLGK